MDQDLTTVLTSEDLLTIRSIVFSDELPNAGLLRTLRDVMIEARNNNGAWLAGPLSRLLFDFNYILEKRGVPYVAAEVISANGVRCWIFKKVPRQD